MNERRTARARKTQNAEALAAALLEVKRQGAVKSLFLGTISRELRTPLHGILGLAELIRKQTSDNRLVQHRLALLESSGTHLLELIGSLLDISRIESGRARTSRGTFRPRHGRYGSSEDVIAQVRRQGAQLQQHFSDG